MRKSTLDDPGLLWSLTAASEDSVEPDAEIVPLPLRPSRRERRRGSGRRLANGRHLISGTPAVSGVEAVRIRPLLDP